ncbi:hypothetical protein V495_06392 [Pseudogymnoascus sp. VKM F-4514 (FW-929)]|nr:hypothetical protein V495_06392 [Pseudogymnoascus sp. VKM F-4514 (FW-929)]KFY54886.1 hypothetical protein V497_07361 [Pseudogymnoascus sp. VKM F-4516 (FW-969)]
MYLTLPRGSLFKVLWQGGRSLTRYNPVNATPHPFRTISLRTSPQPRPLSPTKSQPWPFVPPSSRSRSQPRAELHYCSCTDLCNCGTMMLWVTLSTLPILILVVWLYTVATVKGRFPTLKNRRICLLIAHPDDEAMFFAPALLALNDPALGNHLKILCLSSGDADGLGETRKKELVKSGMLLGLRNEDDVFVVENSDFQDSMTATWSKEKIASLLSSAFAPHLSNTLTSKSADAPTATIDVLITFDRSGVSSHPNHISLYHGARHFIASLIKNRPGWDSPVDLYTLSSHDDRRVLKAHHWRAPLAALIYERPGRDPDGAARDDTRAYKPDAVVSLGLDWNEQVHGSERPAPGEDIMTE